MQIVPTEKPAPAVAAAPRAVAKKSTARNLQNQSAHSVAVPFLPQVGPNHNVVVSAPPSKIVVSIRIYE